MPGGLQLFPFYQVVPYSVCFRLEFEATWHNAMFVRLEQSDFFSQWTRGKMKIQLENPALNISSLTGSKNEKARRGALLEKLRLDLYFD